MFVLQVAEQLYNMGLLSYPRTETDSFKEGTDLAALVQVQCTHSQWGAYAQGLADGKMCRPADGGHDDNAHPPIHPTKADPGNLNDEQRRVFLFMEVDY